MPRLLAIAIGLSAVACSSVPTPSTGAPSIVAGDVPVNARAEDSEANLRLVFELPKTTWSAGEPIEGLATLSVVEGEVAVISGSGSGIVFEFSEIGGDRHVEPIWTADCRRYDITADAPFVQPIKKSGAIDDDFSRSFLNDPLVRLPPGAWEIAAIADFIEGPDCPGPGLTLRAAVQLQVEE